MNTKEASDTPGEIPAELSLLPKLYVLSVERSNVHGSIPPQIVNLSYLPHLKYIDVDNNMITGAFPSVVSSTGKTNADVEVIDANFNMISGGLEFLSSYPNLREAHLDNNKLQGTIPENIGQMTNLGVYYICF